MNTLLEKQIETALNESRYDDATDILLSVLDIKIVIEYKKSGKHFADDTDIRDIYSVTITRGKRSFSFDFGNSLNNSGFYAMQGRKRTYIDRKYLDKTDSFILSHAYMFNLLPKISNDTIHRPKEPTNYDIIACLQKYDIGTFEDFCSEFGYDTDSRKAEKTYNAVLNKYQNMAMLFSDSELELLSLIS